MRLMIPDETSPEFRSLPLGPSGRTHELNEQLSILLLLNPRIASGLCVIHEVGKQCSHVENQKLEPRRDDIDQSNTRTIVLIPFCFSPFGIANPLLQAQATSLFHVTPIFLLCSAVTTAHRRRPYLLGPINSSGA
jgi:hypothetical protein